MKKRKLILIIADFVLLAIFIVQSILSSVDSSKSFVLNEAPDEIHIYNNDNHIDIITIDQGNSWVIGEQKYPANKIFVEDIIKKLSTINTLNKVGSIKNEAEIEKFELDESKCLSVVAKKDGKIIRSIQIGKKPSNVQQVFATIDGNPDIYLVKGDMRSSFEYEEDYLRMKIIYKVDTPTIKSIKYTEINGNTFEVTDDVEKEMFSQFTTDTFVLPQDLSEAKKIYSISVIADKEISMDIYELYTGEVNYNQNGEPEPQIIYIGTSSECAYKFSVPSYYISKLKKN